MPGRLFSQKNLFALIGILIFGGYIFWLNTHAPQLSNNTTQPANQAGNPTAAPTAAKRCGVNMSGGEFGDYAIPGILNKDYHYPAQTEDFQYFSQKNLKIVRIPFLWERLQPRPLQALSAADLAGLKNMVSIAQSANQKVILDLHNFGYYYRQPVTRQNAAQLANVWKRIATEFKDAPNIYGYELMNEPHDLPEGGSGWAEIAQTVVTGIRSVDQNTPILVPGYEWQQARIWQAQNAGLAIQDPSNKIIYTAHQYFDDDYSGKYLRPFAANHTAPQQVEADSKPFLDWLEQHHAQGMFTEFGVPGNQPQWLDVMDRFMKNAFADHNIVGVVYWSAGPWWKNYPLSVQPVTYGGQVHDQPQMIVLGRYCF